MENPIYKAYEKLNNIVMYGADKVAGAWNWTTGRTKADLANKLLTVAPIFEISGITISNTINGINLFSLIIPLYAFGVLGHSHHFQKRNYYIEKKEIEAAEKQALDFEVEDYKMESKNMGSTWYLFSSLGNVSGLYCLHISKNIKESACSAGLISVGIGNFLRGSSFHIMRTRYLPPRKNCLSRAKDKLSEILQERVLRPSPVPIPLPALDYLSVDYKNIAH